ncbi:MAG: hypothetical protein Q4B48_05130 [Syntrophomonadaceae bacterium]|nr:hypothetical protein [Syntrophomonadaceae bacterium]
MPENAEAPKRIKLMISIVERNRGQEVIDFCRMRQAHFHLLCRGYGTADSELQNLLGLGTREKDVVLSVVREEELEPLLEGLRQRLQLNQAGRGIAFTIPIGSVCGHAALAQLAGRMAAAAPQ